MGGGSTGGSALQDILSGTVAGFAQVFAGHPLDTIKVRLQTQSATNPIYSGTMHCARTTLAQEGLSGLYAGASAPLAGAMAHNAGIFFSYGSAKRVVSANGTGNDLSLGQYYQAGSLAAIPISIVETPVDLFKCKLQAPGAAQKYKGLMDVGKQIIGTYGLRGAYQGFGATLLRNIPCFGAYFWGFESAKAALTPKGEIPSLFACFVAGGCGGFAFWGTFYPLEIIKTRMQVDELDPKKRQYKNIVDCFTKTLKNEGYAGFYKGYSATLLRAIPVNASIFCAFTAAKRAFE